jgi:fatty-acyl-CoA synthase
VITDWASRRAALSGRRTAFYDLERRRAYSYAEMASRARRLASLLGALGVASGERVGIVSRNSIAHFDVWLAAGVCGVTAVPLCWRWSRAELEKAARLARLRAVLYSDEFAEKARDLAPHSLPMGAAGERYEARLQDMAEAEPTPPAPSAVAMILFTGGTSGEPKGVRITHRQIFMNAVNTVTSWELSAADRAPVLTPLYHTGGYHVLATPLYHAGGTSLLAQGFSGEAVRAALEAGATVLFLVPTMIQTLLDEGDIVPDLRRLRFLISGGAPCPAPVVERLRALGVSFREGYGLTEVGPNCFAMPAGEEALPPGAVGVPVFHLEASVRDPDGRPLPPGAVGELWLRGETVADGYDQNPTETARTFDSEGFCRTGDLAVQDEKGVFTIVGRLKEMYISGGENVYPGEVERAIRTHPDVVDAAVVGVPDPLWGEVGVAFVVAKAGIRLTAEEVRRHVRQQIAAYKVPKDFVFLERLPLTDAGKVAKAELRASYRSRAGAGDAG